MPRKKVVTCNYVTWCEAADYSVIKGVNAINLAAVECNDVTIDVASFEAGSDDCYANVLVAGPLWDCTSSGDTFIVSSRLKDFLASECADDLRFVPVRIVNEDEGFSHVGYWALGFKHSVVAIEDCSKFNADVLNRCKKRIVVAVDEEEDFWTVVMIESKLAEQMLRLGFTGLGFKDPFAKKKMFRKQLGIEGFPEDALGLPAPCDDVDRVSSVVASSDSLVAGWTDLLAEVLGDEPKGVLTKLKGLAVEKDVAKLESALEKLLEDEPPPAKVNALWFGLIELVGSAGKSQSSLYVCGSTRFSEEQRFSFEWANSPKWLPEGRYLKSSVLESINRMAKGAKDKALARKLEHLLVLGYGALVVKFALRTLAPKKTLKFDCLQKPIAVGFDDGDAVYIQ